MLVRLLLPLLIALPLRCAEHAVLETGFRLRVERHEERGEMVRLYTSSGTLDLPKSTIVAFESDEFVAPQPPTVVASDAPAGKSDPPVALTPEQLVERAAQELRLPVAFVRSVAHAESGFRQDAVSPKGAIGIMQLMPATAASLHADPHDAEQNVRAGVQLLRDLLAKYESHPDQVRLALAAYNAGSGAVARYKGVPPYRETQRYVERIVAEYLKNRR